MRGFDRGQAVSWQVERCSEHSLDHFGIHCNFNGRKAVLTTHSFSDRLLLRGKSAGLAAGAILIVAACGGDSATDPPPPDTQPPTVSITGPSAGSVTGQVTISATAADDRSVKFVQFLVNGGLVSADSVAPYEYVWDTSLYAVGIYDWTARAVDGAGHATTSQPVTYTVGP